MIKVERIDHLNMGVISLKETTEFYHKLFGFEVLENGVSQHSGADYAIIGRSGHGVLCIYERGHSSKVVNDYKDAKVYHWGFHVENFNEAFDAIKELGVEYQYGGPVDQGGSRSLYIYDNNGYEIEIAEKLAGGL